MRSRTALGFAVVRMVTAWSACNSSALSTLYLIKDGFS